MLWRVAGATGTGAVFGGKRGATIGLAASTFFSLATPEMVSTAIWRTSQSLRIGAPLAGGGRSLIAINPLAGAKEAAGKKVGGLGAGALVAGYTIGALAGTAIVGYGEKEGVFTEGSTDDVSDLYLSLVGFGDRSATKAATDLYDSLTSLPSLLEKEYSMKAVPNNAGGYPEGTVIDSNTGRPKATSSRVQAYIDMYNAGEYIGY
jgi:hypothetical protein